MGEEKKRKLRLSHELNASNSKLLHFDDGNPLLILHQPILLTRGKVKSSNISRRRLITADSSQPQLIQRKPVTFRELDLPSRRHRNTQDPLDDELYLTFHRRMRKDERSVALSDKSKLQFDIDNLRGQLELLNQHDWVKHLPLMVHLNDRNDYDELVKKRNMARKEIQKTLEKFQDWEARCVSHAATVKNFLKGNIGLGDEDDSDGLILSRSISSLAKERAALRIALHGMPVRLVLRNGYDLLAMPHRKPRVVPTGTS